MESEDKEWRGKIKNGEGRYRMEIKDKEWRGNIQKGEGR